LKFPGERLLKHYFECSFKIEDQKVLLTDFRCQYSEREQIIKTYLLQHKPNQFPSSNTADSFGKDIANYLNIADVIAKQGYHCSSGDEYFPGFYSEISIEEFWITLKQINHYNSRSLNHKENYHLRDLEFYIPIGTSEPEKIFQSENIGKMNIVLSDRSSKNNKNCGEQILQKIKEQKLLFEQ
jgi:hypothetical protein